jgi:hypothetical protein
MNRWLTALLLSSLVCGSSCTAYAQEATGEPVGEGEVQKSARDTSEDLVTEARKSVDRFASEVDQSQRAQQASESVLKPIYTLAEYLSFPAFHWLAFAIMVAGVVSFALQLVLAKLVVLAKSSFSLSEVLSDALGLVISLVGLVLTTQAATENSNFTQSAFAVLSATVVGAVAGLIFYWWAQRQEVEAVRGRKQAAS